jgi:hypothetical protein
MILEEFALLRVRTGSTAPGTKIPDLAKGF